MHQLFTDGVVYPTVDRSRCTSLLHQHLFQHVIHLRNQFYTQGAGIPQGSVLSTLLCNYYYAAMEEEHLAMTAAAPPEVWTCVGGCGGGGGEGYPRAPVTPPSERAVSVRAFCAHGAVCCVASHTPGA